MSSLRERLVRSDSLSSRSSVSSRMRTETTLCPSSPRRGCFLLFLSRLPCHHSVLLSIV